MNRSILILALFSLLGASNLSAQVLSEDFSSISLSSNANSNINYQTFPRDEWYVGRYNGSVDFGYSIVGGEVVQNSANLAGQSNSGALAYVFDLSSFSAGDYTLSFDYRAETTGFSVALWTANVAGAGFYSITNLTPRVNASWTNTSNLVDATAFAATGSSNLTSASISFSVPQATIDAGGLASLNFLSDGLGDTGLAFDNIVIEAAAIPEPSTVTLVSCVGVIGFMLVRRRLR